MKEARKAKKGAIPASLLSSRSTLARTDQKMEKKSSKSLRMNECSSSTAGSGKRQRETTTAASDTGLPISKVAAPAMILSGTSSQASEMFLEARSARDRAWFDVHSVLSYRRGSTGNPEVEVRFEGFSDKYAEWVDAHKALRQRSLPCDDSDCVIVLPGDLILCFQEGPKQALHYDADVLDVKRRRHDARGCRCTFLVRYRHDETMEFLPLRKICRRPETEFRVRLCQRKPPVTTVMADYQDAIPLIMAGPVESEITFHGAVTVVYTQTVETILARSNLVVVTSEDIPQAILVK